MPVVINACRAACLVIALGYASSTVAANVASASATLTFDFTGAFSGAVNETANVLFSTLPQGTTVTHPINSGGGASGSTSGSQTAGGIPLADQAAIALAFGSPYDVNFPTIQIDVTADGMAHAGGDSISLSRTEETLIFFDYTGGESSLELNFDYSLEWQTAVGATGPGISAAGVLINAYLIPGGSSDHLAAVSQQNLAPCQKSLGLCAFGDFIQNFLFAAGSETDGAPTTPGHFTLQVPDTTAGPFALLFRTQADLATAVTAVPLPAPVYLLGSALLLLGRRGTRSAPAPLLTH